MTKAPEKASDLFDRSQPAFGSKASFAEAFPTIECLRAEVTERSIGVPGHSTRVYTHESYPGEYVNCSSPQCYGGGFSLGYLLRQMVSRGETHLETNERCKGHEGSSRKRGRACLNHFDIPIAIVYRSTTE